VVCAECQFTIVCRSHCLPGPKMWGHQMEASQDNEPRQALSSGTGTGGAAAADGDVDIEPPLNNLLSKSPLPFHLILQPTTPNITISTRHSNHGPPTPPIRPPTRRPLPLPPLPTRRPPQTRSKPTQLRGFRTAGVRSLPAIGQERFQRD
jgi:hypothetical protein